jgi:7-carboxy-7-deazaguanine synthase
MGNIGKRINMGGTEVKGLRLNEMYPTIQGEGPNVGVPTTFVRFSGCNMRCPGWPCDTQHAIQPELWKNDPVVTVEKLLSMVADFKPRHVCITGGEPTMQNAEMLEQFADLLLGFGYSIDVFTNGSLKVFPTWMQEDADVTVILDWKLLGSGEQETGLSIRYENAHKLKSTDAVKFVIATDEDYAEALITWQMLEEFCYAQPYIGVAWGLYEESKLVTKVIEDGLPWHVNTQIHKYIFPGVERGI